MRKYTDEQLYQMQVALHEEVNQAFAEGRAVRYPEWSFKLEGEDLEAYRAVHARVEREYRYCTGPNGERMGSIKRPDVDAFLNEVIEVCKKHGFSLSHEDRHGAFVVRPVSESNFEWLYAASVNEGPES